MVRSAIVPKAVQQFARVGKPKILLLHRLLHNAVQQWKPNFVKGNVKSKRRNANRHAKRR
jgi:hypothetical protein